MRLILNLVRKGTVIEVDHDKELCRVQSGDLQSNWIRWLALAAGDTRDWNPPTAGEQVLMLCPGGELADGVALRGIYTDDIAAPSHKPSAHTRAYPDGAVIEYDHEAHTLTAILPAGAAVQLDAPASVTVNTKTATVNASDSATIKATTVTIDAQDTNCTGNLTVQKMLAFNGGMTGKAGAGGGAAVSIQGDVAATGDVKAGNISAINHTHMEQGDGKAVSKPQ